MSTEATQNNPKNAIIYACENCDFKCSKKNNYDSHILDHIHTLSTESTQINSKNAALYVCKNCDFKCSKKSNYTTHILTRKHTLSTDTANKNANHDNIFICFCGKKYNDRSGLWRHKKNCSKEVKLVVTEIEDDKNDEKNNSNIILEILKHHQTNLDNTATDSKDSLIMELVKQNQEFKELMMEQNKYMIDQNKNILELAKNAGHNNTNSHNNTTNNNKFNLQLFLNETCKDAMNITEFVNSLVLNFEDLENMGHLGYVEGICKIFLRGLRGVEVTKRPFHCSDVKRETMFVKDLAGWEKENSDNEKLTATIKRIAGKNFKQATAWMANHPKAVLETDSHPHMQYMKMMSQCLGGLTAAEDKSNYNKIIKRVAQEVLIDKGKE